MIVVSDLIKRYDGKPAVNGINFIAEQGKTLVLLGPSGCGKSTTLKMINRLIEPDGGSIFISGKNTANQNLQDLRKRIGYVIQQGGLFPHYTVEQNIATVPNLLGWEKESIRSKTTDLLEMLRLSTSLLSKYPDQLSGGQQQRVGIARALAADQEIILMDEPFGALDPITRKEIRVEFKSLLKKVSKTVVLVTHDISEAIELGDKIILLEKGQIAQEGKPSAFIQNPSNEFVKQFFEKDQWIYQFKTMLLSELGIQNSGNDTIADIFSKKSPYDKRKVFEAYLNRIAD